MEPVFGLDLTLPPRGSRARLRSLHGLLRNAITEGRLHAGSQLPSSRVLAQACGLSRNTVVAAYELLLSEGYVVTRAGGGTIVAAVPQRAQARAATGNSSVDERLSAAWRGRSPMARPTPRVLLPFDFALGVPDRRAFAVDIWRRLGARALRQINRTSAQYSDAQGVAELREAVASHVSLTRAVACAATDVVITSGAQQGFDLLARVLVTAGRTVVAVEEPGYPPLRRVFGAAGARIVHVPVDSQGLRVDRLPEAARVVCVTPSHQFPMGVAMSAERRRELIDWAHGHGACIIEDDYDGEFRFGARPLDALQTLAGGHSVFYVGTFSKVLFPGLRLGFVVTPAWARNALVAAKQDADWHCATVAQETLAAFIAEGHLARHLRKMRRVYGERREELLSAVERHLAERLSPVQAECGLHLTFMLSMRRSDAALPEAARSAGVGVAALSAFFADGPPAQGLVLGIGHIETSRISDGIRRLAALLG